MRKRHQATTKFVVCIWNDNGETDLHILKVYVQIPDSNAEQDGMIRVIDESGEDYLYPTDYFLPLELPKSAEKILDRAAELQSV